MLSSISGFYPVDGNTTPPRTHTHTHTHTHPNPKCLQTLPEGQNHSWLRITDLYVDFLQARNKWFTGKNLTVNGLGEKVLVCTVCQFLWCKYSVSGLFQATNAINLLAKLF